MRTSFIVKLNFLLLGLGLTIYLSYQLQHRGLSPNILELFGLRPAANSSPTKSQDDSFSWNWCDTKVTAMIRPEEFKLAQEGNMWVYESAAKQIVNFLSVDSWLKRFCSVKAERAATASAADESFKPTLMVKFEDGHVELIRRAPDGRYLWRGQSFTSSEFDSALAELSALPLSEASK